MDKFKEIKKEAEQLKAQNNLNLEIDQIILSLLNQYQITIPEALSEGLITNKTTLPLTHVDTKLKDEESIKLKISDLTIDTENPHNILLYRGFDIHIDENFHYSAGKNITSFEFETFGQKLKHFLENKKDPKAKEILERISRNEIIETEDLTQEEIQYISYIGSDRFIGMDFTVHTTFNYFIAEEFKDSGYQSGTLITISIPISSLNTENGIYMGNIGESEINFFWEIPEEYIKKVEY